MAQAIGQLLNQQKLTASPQPSAISLTGDIKRILDTGIQTEADCRKLQIWADNTKDTVDKATPEQVARHVQFLAATLPSKNTDLETGAMKTTVYLRFLGEYSNAALAYMTQEVCRTMDWFPSVRQCLEILATYRPPVTNRDKALMLVSRWTAERFDAWLQDIKNDTIPQHDIDGAPDRWKRIAEEQCLLRRQEDGTYIVRRKLIGDAA